MSPWLALVNPHATQGPRAMTKIETAFRRRGISGDVIEVDGLGALHEAINMATSQGRTRFVAVGGDGTVNAVLNALLTHLWEEPPVLGVLPAGSGCDLMRTFGVGNLGVGNLMESAVDRLVGKTTYPVDVGVAIGEWGRRFFLNVASAGATAAAAQAALRIPGWLRTLRYVGGVVGSLPAFRRCEVSVEAGARRFVGESLAVIFANGQFFGGGFNIAPRASMVDQLFDVQVITARKREIGRLMSKARGGNHLADPTVRRFAAPEVRLESSDPWPVEVDGELIGTTPVLLRLQTGRIALKI